METLRIAILTETLPPNSLKLQPWRYLGELARALQDAGHEASALTTEANVPTWNGVRVDRHPEAIDFRSARRLHRLLETRGYDAGIVRLTASLFFSLHREPGTPPSKGRLIGIFLRPLHNGWALARRFLDPTLVPEIRLDLHHAPSSAPRPIGTWTPPAPVFPYRFLRTGLPLVVLEAVAAGLPVVTTRVHPIRELEGRTGLVFAKPRNPPDIARAIESVFDDAQRAAVVRKNDEWFRTTPDWSTVAKTFVSFVRR